MRRRPIFYAYLASALLIGLPLSGANAQTGTGSTSGTGTGTQGTNGTGTTGTTGTRSGTTGTRSGTTGTRSGTRGTTGTTGSGYMNGNGTGTGTDMNGSYGQTGVTGNGVTGTGSMRVGDTYNGPAINFTSTPDIAAIPGTQISYIRNSDYDMYRSGTDWYLRSDGRWYRGTSYNGPFTYVTTTTVPRGIRTVPARYRHHWTTASSASTRTSVSGTRSRNASASKARVKSRHKARTTGYSKTSRSRSTRTHSTSSSMGTGTSSSYDDSHASGMDNTSSSSMGGNSMDNGTTMGGTGSSSSGMGSSGSMGSMTGTAGQPYSGPAITFQSPPTVAIIPGTQVSYLRNSDYDMYQYGTDWYMNYNGTWYRGSNYSGPYVTVESTTVPQPIVTVPVQYRRHWH